MGERKLRGKIGIATALALLCVSAAFGSAVPATLNIIQVQATSGGHTATFEQVFPVSSIDGVLPWAISSPVTLSDGSYNLATIKNLQVTFNADPQVDLAFALVNGSTSTVSFDIQTATILFDGIPNAEAAAGASVTLTQGAGSTAGGSIAGLFPNNKVYQARYSTNDISNTKTVFGSLVPSMSFSNGLGLSASEGLPATGTVSLGTTVYMMESEFKFTLSAGDQASGTSAFVITPEPASMMLLALGVCLLRRR
jgi:hypothetical protein